MQLYNLDENNTLGIEISKILKIPLSKVTVNKFSDGEQSVHLGEDCKNKKVFFIQSTSQPDSNFIKLVLAVDAARRASAKEIITIIPYFGYARQERKSEQGTPISARVFAEILETMGVKKVITMDLHAKAIEGFFFKTVLEHLYARDEFVKILQKDFKNEINKNQLIVVAPDTGAAGNARSFGLKLLNHQELAIISKGREKANVISSMQLVGEVEDKVAVLVDDMADTCGTLVKAAELLKQKGAKKIIAVVTHPIFSGNAIEKLSNSELDLIYTTNSILHKDLPKKIKIVSVAKIFSQAVNEA